jgi:hypothetical protein
MGRWRMVFLDIIEVLVIFLILYGTMTQVIIPIYRGTTLFPFFRKKPVDPIEEEMAKADEEIHTAKLKKEVITKQKMAKKILENEEEQNHKGEV